MWPRRLIPFGCLLLGLGLCSGCIWPLCLWPLFERLRFSFTYDISDGRTVTVWSIRRDIIKDFLEHGHLDTDPNPLMVYYRIDRNGTELAPTTFLEHDDGKEYQFKVLVAEGGQLVCVCEVSRGSDNSYLTILYDARSGESWPRDQHIWYFRKIKRKWQERFERLQREHPSFRMPRDFLE